MSFTMIFLESATRKFFSESHSFVGTPSDRDLDRLVDGRLRLLGNNIELVSLAGKKVRLRGKGGGYGFPDFVVRLRDDGQHIQFPLHAVPKEVYAGQKLTPAGIAAMKAFSDALARCGRAFKIRGVDELVPVRNLHPTRFTSNVVDKCEKATLTHLKKWLGEAEARRIWEATKQEKRVRGASPAQSI